MLKQCLDMQTHRWILKLIIFYYFLFFKSQWDWEQILFYNANLQTAE